MLISLAAKKGKFDKELSSPEKSPDTSKDEIKSADTPEFGNKPGDHSPQDNVSVGGKDKSGNDPMLKRRSSVSSAQSPLSRPKNTYTQVDDFPRLIEQMKGTLATQILDGVIDFTALMRKLMQIVFAAVITQSVDKNPNDKSIGNEELAALIQHSLDLLLPCVMWQPGLLLKEIY